MNRLVATFALLCIASLMHGTPLSAQAVTSTFTYQGRLQDAGQPANGLFDLKFQLFLTSSAPTTSFPDVLLEDVPVQNGVFSVALNFGANAFDGQQRWLAIGVRDGASVGVYDQLGSRQELTATPYALYALNGNPGPQGPAGTTGQDVFAAYSSSAITLTPTTAYTAIPGMTLTVTLPAASKVLISTYGGMQTTSTTASTGFSSVDVAVIADGTFLPNAGRQRLNAANTGGITGVVEHWSMTAAPVLSAGSHTITVRARGNSIGENATVAGDSASVLRGELNLTIIKQ